ncbi:MAG: FecR domain-containing protein [Phaeodactylibacter sp.]|uniref:FecR family protein n=1 Tax=Phaeodactylibacter sp. TaxID=1940289 RepID=UPI0032EC92D4
MKLTEYITLFHRQQTGQLGAEEAQAFQQEHDPELHQELDELWSDSRSYKAGYEPDVDKGFSRLKFRMEADQPREAKTVQLKTKSGKWMRAAAAIALLIAFGSYWFATADDAAQGLVYTTASDEKIQITLPDASVVYLNEHSYLSYEAGEGKRKVSLTGEAYFEVASNPEQPFVIYSNDVRTTVLGTAFNLRAYPDEPTVEVEVTEGHVRMEKDQAAQKIELQPKERGIFSMDKQRLYKEPSPELNAQGWRSQRMVFRDAQLSSALKEIGRYYKVEFKLKNPGLQDCALSTEIKADPLSNFLQVLEAVYGLEVQKSGPATYALSGGRCN